MPSDTDKEILNEFITETTELLDSLDEKFIALEKETSNTALINEIFRSIHSIKGSSAFFSLTNIKSVAHKMENLLDELRKQSIKITKEIIDLLLEGIDRLKWMLKTTITEETHALSEADKSYIEKLSELLTVKKRLEDNIYEPIFTEIYSCINSLNMTDDLKKLKGLIDNLNTQIKTAKDIKQPDNSGIKNNIRCHMDGVDISLEIAFLKQFFESFNSGRPDDTICRSFVKHIDSLSSKLSSCKVKAAYNNVTELKNLFNFSKDTPGNFDKHIVSSMKDTFKKILDETNVTEIAKLGEILVDKDIVSHDQIKEVIAMQSRGDERKIGEILTNELGVDKELVKGALREQADKILEKSSQETRQDLKKTMRIDEEKIDSFMTSVGELITSAEVFNYLQKKLDNTRGYPEICKEFKNANMAFNDLSNQLHESLMEVRKVSLKPMLQKLPRMVREVAKNFDKEIILNITGDETRIDKSILEHIEAPIVHIIRNSIDHGIETNEERLRLNKNKNGTINIEASNDENFFYLTIKDDGKGVDVAKVKEAAYKKGIIDKTRYETIYDKDAVNLIFLPGFSTAEKVTEVSGRGVGMDVVLENMKKINGTVDVSSETGKGTKTSLKIPLKLTLIVVDGLLVKVGAERFIIPIKHVKESIQPKEGGIVTVTGKGEMVDIRGKLFPLIRLYKMFNIIPVSDSPYKSLVVAVESNGKYGGILVDQVLSQQQVVSKNLGDNTKRTDIISGAAIMGDGKVGLIIDIDGVIKMANG